MTRNSLCLSYLFFSNLCKLKFINKTPSLPIDRFVIFIIYGKNMSKVDFKTLTDISPLGVALEPSFVLTKCSIIAYIKLLVRKSFIRFSF